MSNSVASYKKETLKNSGQSRHCEALNHTRFRAEAISKWLQDKVWDCFASLAMTRLVSISSLSQYPQKVWIYALIMSGLCSCATPSNIAVLQRAVEERPEEFKAHLELAKAYLGRGVRWEVAPGVGVPIPTSKRWLKKAQREFERASELDPLSPEPHYWLKVIYTARGKYREADEESALYGNLEARRKERESSP